MTDLLADYAEERGAEIVAGERLAYAVSALVGFWDGKTVDAVTPQSCQAYGRHRGKSDGTVRRELGVLRAAINHAVTENRLVHGVSVKLPNRPPSKDRWLTKGEAARLLKAALSSAKSRLYLPLFIMIGLHTGARKEAILSLRWDQVDLAAGMIHWNPTGRNQTNKRRPKARIPPKLLGHLRRAYKRRDLNLSEGVLDIGFVVHRDGARLADIKKGFASACARAGLKDVTPHTMRHSRATWGMQGGTSKWELAGFLGMSEETLDRVYGHHHPEYQKHAAETY